MRIHSSKLIYCDYFPIKTNPILINANDVRLKAVQNELYSVLKNEITINQQPKKTTIDSPGWTIQLNILRSQSSAMIPLWSYAIVPILFPINTATVWVLAQIIFLFRTCHVNFR